MSARSELVAILRTELPDDWTVRDFDTDDLGNLTRTTVTVQQTALTGMVSTGVWTSTLVVDVVAPQQAYDAAEEALETAMLEVLSVLRTAPETRNRIDSAQRIVRGARHHAWRFNLTLTQKEQ
jgi:hypothetical protein